MRPPLPTLSRAAASCSFGALLTLIIASGHACTPGPANACKATKDCDGGAFFCSDAGLCEAVPACPATPCAAGSVCVAARCQPTSCTGKTCGADQYCRQGTCADIACAQKSCGPGEICAKGACLVAQCAGASCLESEYCVNEACTSLACFAVGCAVAERCAADGKCYPTGAPGTPGCGGRCNVTESCVAGLCQETRCIGVTCAANELCGGGLCSPVLCGNITCPTGRVCGITQYCQEPACAQVQCQAGYVCSRGLCAPAPKDGGVVDAGPTPDAGPVDAGCHPPSCYVPETDCANGFDDNADGKIDCLDPSCNARACEDHNPCTFNTTCQFSQCRTTATQDTVVCNSPPAGICLKTTGSCQPDRSCTYGLDIGAACGPAGQVCRSDGGCSVPPTTPGFPFPVSNLDAGAITRPALDVVVQGGEATFNSTDGGFGGTWASIHPAVAYVTTPTGPATVLAANSLRVEPSGSIRLTGNRPVIFLMGDTIILHGPIDAAGHGTVPGAGGNLAICQVPVGTGANPVPPAGGNGAAYGTAGIAGLGVAGSGGGGAGGPGGRGGQGGQASTQGASGNAGGKAGAQYVRAGSQLMGGCSGGTGGHGTSTGGAGGGALQLVAGNSIILDSTWIDVSGAAGVGGTHVVSDTSGAGGAGGGGSAGTLILEAPLVSGYYATLVANGGSGGEGAGRLSDNATALDGNGGNGADGRTAVCTQPAPGGTGQTFNGGNGGNGGAVGLGATAGQDGVLWTDPTLSYANVEGGGGGGGGAAASILINIPGGGGCDLPKATCQLSPGLTTNVANRCNQ